MEQVEEERGQWHLVAQALGIGATGRAGAGHLERFGSAVSPHGEDLAIEHRSADVQPGEGLDHLREAVGDLLESPGEEAHLTLVDVCLQADPVQLGLDEHLAAQAGQGSSDIRRGPGEHRPERAPDLEGERLESGDSALQSRARHGSGMPGEHDGTANRRVRDVSGLGDGLEHDSVAGALPSLAGQQSPQPALLVRGREGEQGGDRGRAPRGGAGSAQAPDLRGGGVHVLDREGRLGRGLGQPLQTAPAHTDPTLREDSGEVRRDDLDRLRSVRRGAHQAGGEGLDLGRAGGGRGHGARGVDDLSEEHLSILSRGADILRSDGSKPPSADGDADDQCPQGHGLGLDRMNPRATR